MVIWWINATFSTGFRQRNFKDHLSFPVVENQNVPVSQKKSGVDQKKEEIQQQNLIREL